MSLRLIRHAALALALALAAPLAAAHADELGSREDQSGKITRVKKGVWELGIDSLAIFSYDKQGDASVARLSSTVNGRLMYFLKDNVSLGAYGSFLVKKSGPDDRDLGIGGGLMANLHLRLGEGAFFRPGLGLGFQSSSRQVSLGAGMLAQSKIVGFTTRLALPLAYYASEKFLLQAGPELDLTVGNETPDAGGASTSFTSVDGGFSVGLGYAF